MFASRASAAEVQRTGIGSPACPAPSSWSFRGRHHRGERALGIRAARRARCRARSARRVIGRPGSRMDWSASPSRSRTPDTSRRPRASRPRAGRWFAASSGCRRGRRGTSSGGLLPSRSSAIGQRRLTLSIRGCPEAAAPHDPGRGPRVCSGSSARGIPDRSAVQARDRRNGPEAGDLQAARSGKRVRRHEERLDGVAVAAVVAAHVLDVTEEAIGSLRQSCHRARDHARVPPRKGSSRAGTRSAARENRRTGRSARLPGGRSNISRSSAPHSKDPRISPRSANSLVARHVWDSPLRRAFELERLRLGNERAHREDRDPVAGPRERDLVAAGNEQRTLDTCHARL